MSVFVPRAVTFEGRLMVSGEASGVFPLFSPVGERSWVPGWDPELLHPPGADWEEGQIFRTREETGEAVWLVARLDRVGLQVAYYRVEAGRYVAHITVGCHQAPGHRTEVRTAYSFVGLSEQGNRDITAMTRQEYDAKMTRWSEWIGRLQAARGDESRP